MNWDSILKNRVITLLTKVCILKAMVLPVVTYRCESWTTNKAECWRIYVFKLVLEKTLESPLDCKEIKPVNPTGNQPWLFIGRTDAEAEAEAPILWPPDAKSRLIGKDPDAGKGWGKKKGTTEDEMVGWHHWLNGHGSEPTRGDSEGQGGQACWRSWGRQESDTNEDWTTEQPHPYFLQQPTFVDHTSIHYSDTPKPWESSWIPFHFLPPQIQSPSHQSFTSSSQVPQSLT